MTILQELYKFTEPTTASMASSLYFPLNTPLKKLNSLEFDLFNEDAIVSTLWNFGDPFGVDNEIVSGSILDVIDHTYNYAGNYEINCLANVDGTIKHITSNLNIVPDSGSRVITSQPEGTYTIFIYNGFNFELELFCYDNKATIYYAFGASATEFNKYTAPLTATDDFVIKYYATFNNGYSTEIFTKTFVLERNQYDLLINPVQSVQAGSFNMSLFSIPSIVGNPDFKIYYTTTQNPTPTLYTGLVTITESTTITAWIVHTYLGTDYTYDPIIKNYVI